MPEVEGISFKVVDFGSRDYHDCVMLREEILRKPLGLSFSSKELDLEKDHIHIAGFIGNDLCATAVLVPDGSSYKMQRVAIKANLQTKGIGSAMMSYCEAYAIKNGVKSIYCSARHTAIPFYLKNGYQLDGHQYEEDGIPHQRMQKNLVLKLKL